MSKSLTLGETAKVESIAGAPIDALGDPTAPKGRLLAALVMVLKQRSQPDFTLDDAMNMDAAEAGDLIDTFFN